jgi:hypothetical protein
LETYLINHKNYFPSFFVTNLKSKKIKKTRHVSDLAFVSFQICVEKIYIDKDFCFFVWKGLFGKLPEKFESFWICSIELSRRNGLFGKDIDLGLQIWAIYFQPNPTNCILSMIDQMSNFNIKNCRSSY